jgi:hypothetical protein
VEAYAIQLLEIFDKAVVGAWNAVSRKEEMQKG